MFWAFLNKVSYNQGSNKEFDHEGKNKGIMAIMDDATAVVTQFWHNYCFMMVAAYARWLDFNDNCFGPQSRFAEILQSKHKDPLKNFPFPDF